MIFLCTLCFILLCFDIFLLILVVLLICFDFHFCVFWFLHFCFLFLFVLKVRKIKNIKLGGERTWIWEEWGRGKRDLSTCLLAICKPFKIHLFKSFPYLKTDFFFFFFYCWHCRVLQVYILNIIWYVICRYFSHSVGCPFTMLMGSLMHKNFWLCWYPKCLFFLLQLRPFLCPWNCCQVDCHDLFSLLSSLFLLCV